MCAENCSGRAASQAERQVQRQQRGIVPEDLQGPGSLEPNRQCEEGTAGMFRPIEAAVEGSPLGRKDMGDAAVKRGGGVERGCGGCCGITGCFHSSPVLLSCWFPWQLEVSESRLSDLGKNLLEAFQESFCFPDLKKKKKHCRHSSSLLSFCP